MLSTKVGRLMRAHTSVLASSFSVQGPSAAETSGNAIGYAYDPGGNLAQLTYPDGKQVSYTYDQNNRLTTVTDWASRQTSYAYDNNGGLVQTLYPDRTQETRSYDVSGKLTTIAHLDAQGNVIYSCTNTIAVRIIRSRCAEHHGYCLLLH
jgi:YD repeat-containing protein